MNIAEEEWQQLEKFFLDQAGLSMQEDILLLYHFTKNLQFKNVLELGIGEEANSTKAFCYAISQLTGSKFTSVDNNEEHIKLCQETLKKYDLDKYVTCISFDSIEFLKNAKKNFYDCIFIDTTHEYEQTISEITWASEKINPAGYIFLHDTRKEGVTNAITQFLQNPLYMFTEFNTLAGLGLITKKSYGSLLEKIWNLKGFKK